MINSGIPWVKAIPSHWKCRRIEELFIESVQKNIFYEFDHALKFTYGELVPKDEEGDVSELKGTYLAYSIIDKDDIAINGLNLNFDFVSQRVARCPQRGILTSAYLILKPKDKRYSRYYTYLFKSWDYQKVFHGMGKGVRLTLSFAELKKKLIPVPPMGELLKIADFLDEMVAEIDTAITEAQFLIDKYKTYKQSVITQTVTKGLNTDVQMKDSCIPWIGDIPLHWRTDKVKYHLEINEYKGYPDAKVLSLYRDLGVIPKDSRDDNHNVTSEDTSKYKHVDVGNFVVNKMKAWQGSVAVSNYEGIVSPAYYVYKFSSNAFCKEYFHYLLRDKSYTPEFRRLSGGIREGQWDLSREGFRNIPVIIPPLEEQQMIADYLDKKTKEIDAIITQKEKLVSLLQDYKKSIIFEYVTGKKEVPNG